MNIRSFKTPVIAAGVGLLLMGGMHTTARAETTCRADVVFAMDNTGSMGGIIRSTTAAAKKILDKISGGDPRFEGIDVQFGVTTYWGDPVEYEGGGAAKFKGYWWCGPTASYPTRGTTGSYKTYHDRGWYDSYRCDYGTPRKVSDDSKSYCRRWYGAKACDLPGEGGVYVADNTLDRVVKFDFEGTFKTSWGRDGRGSGKFNQTNDVATDSAGNVYVVDKYNHRIQKFDKDGKFLLKWGGFHRGGGAYGTGGIARCRRYWADPPHCSGGEGKFWRPNAIAIDGSDNVYVADAINRRIQKFDTDGKFLLTWGSCESGDTQFSKIAGLATDSAGNVYVGQSGGGDCADRGEAGNKVRKFNASGTEIGGWGGYGTTEKGKFRGITAIAVDGEDNVWVLDQMNTDVQKFTSSGTFLLRIGGFGRVGSGSGDGQFRAPRGLTVDADDNIYVSDSYLHRIQKFDKDGNFLKKWSKKHARCSGAGSDTDPHLTGGDLCSPEGIHAFGSGGSDAAIKKVTAKAYKVNQQLTADKSKVARAMTEWAACSSPGGCGGDWPEANLFALHQLATEGGITDGKGYYDPTTDTTGKDTDEGYFSCGRSGKIQNPDWATEMASEIAAGTKPATAPYVDPWSLDPDKRKRACAQSVGWRDDAARVVVWFGDAPSHNTTVTREEAINALNDRNIVVAGINTGRKNQFMDTCHNLRSGGHSWGDNCGRGGYSRIGDPTAVTEATKGTMNHEVKGDAVVVDAILSGVAAATAQAGSQGMVAFSSRVFSPDVKMYKTKFIGDELSGDLIAKSLDEVGKEAAEVWSAAEIMTAKGVKKNAYSSYQTYSKGESTGHGSFRLDWSSCQKHSACNLDLSTNPTGSTDGAGEDRLNWLLGERSKEGSPLRVREATKGLMGDVWHSSPVHLGPSVSPWWDGMAHVKKGISFKKFQEKTKDRTPVVYVGSNGGPLHAFNAKTGSELFAYYPRSLFSADTNRGYHYLSEEDYDGHVYVDGTPAVSDVVIGRQWQTVLVGTLAKGGRGIFALNVTDPIRFTAGGAKFEPYLWEFTNRDDAHFGYSQGKATIALANNGEWVVLIGNGPESTATGKDAGTSQLFILNISGPGPDGVWDLGTDYQRITTHMGNSINRNGGFSAEAVDLNGDGTVDRAYMGDLYSHIWAFDLSSSKPERWKPAYGDKPLFSGMTEEEDSHTQPITVRPLVTMPPRAVTKWFPDTLGAPVDGPSSGALKLAKTGDGEAATVRGATGVSSKGGVLGGNGLMVYFGTGRLIDTEDRTLKYEQYYYGVHDRGIPDRGTEHLVRQRFLNDGSACSESVDADGEPCGRVTDLALKVDYSKKSGWYIPLPEVGERVIHRSLVRKGMILFTTVVPTQSVCETGGHGWEMVVKMNNGGSAKDALYDADRDGVIRPDDGMLIDTGKGEPERIGLAGRKLSAGLPAGSVMFKDRRYTPTSGDDTDKTVADSGSIEYTGTEGCVTPEERDRESTTPVCGRLSWMELQPRGN